MLHLTIIRPGGQVFRRSFASDSIVIGRGEKCDLRLVNSMVSRNHCLILPDRDGFMIKDLASQNGTWVNGQKVTSFDALKKGDAIQVGPFRLIIAAGTAAAPSSEISLGPELRHFDDGNEQKGRVEEVVKPVGLTDYVAESTADLHRVISTERRERLHRNLLALYSIAENLVLTTDLDEILAHIMDRIFELLTPSQATILLNGKDGRPVVTQRNAAGMGNPRSISRKVINRILKERVGIITDNVLEDPLFAADDTVVIDGIRSIMAAPVWAARRIFGVIYVDSLDRIGGYRPEDLDLLTAVGHQTALAIQRWDLTRKLNDAAVNNAVIRKNLGRYHSDQVVDLILKGAADLNARDTVASVFFCDIVDFTSLCETATPEQLQQVLTLFCRTVNETVFEEQGTLDKFIGDAAMAFFGAPLAQEDAPVRAVRCALTIRERLAREMPLLPAGLRFRVRYGINTGRAIVGNFGSSDRMEYTILGHAVNLAARISKSADPDQVLIGPETYNHITEKNTFKTREVGARKLKGLKETMKLFAVEAPL